MTVRIKINIKVEAKEHHQPQSLRGAPLKPKVQVAKALEFMYKKENYEVGDDNLAVNQTPHLGPIQVRTRLG